MNNAQSREDTGSGLMVKINVKTRGDSSPKGKSKVYFSCHPEDFSEYFDILCEDIFATQNCAVYYLSEEIREPDREELSAILADMQMFVIPVTTKYLDEDCFARTFEFSFAMEHHIPVLPITVEENAAARFAGRMDEIRKGYGDVQFLNHTSQDITEIPYTEKLENLLREVLIGDKLADRIKDAFDTYVFLSYRKKDRLYAKKLMKRIHQIPGCRDIAIWYDEYLVPGENWSQAITEALEKSSMVTMVVTPSLLEPGNYVIEHEYPDAVAKGKKVIPVELSKTNRKELRHLFAGMDDPIAEQDDRAMSRALGSIVNHKDDDSPEHSYLIGLAYLAAIDVERDVDRAVYLITTAAEAGYSEAIRKLISMYETGEGVERNYHTAIMWQEKLVSLLEKLPEDSSLNRDHYSALVHLVDRYRKISQYQEAVQAGKKLLQYVRQKHDNAPSADTRHALFVAHERLASVHLDAGKLFSSGDHYSSALKISEELVEELKTPGARYNLFVCYTGMGSISSSMAMIPAARDYFQRAVEIAETIEKEVRTVRTRGSLATAYSNLSVVCKKEGKLREALEYIRKTVQIREELTGEIGTFETKQELERGYRNLGDIQQNLGNRASAKESFEKALRIQTELQEETKTVSAGVALCIDYQRMGGICRVDGDLVSAESYYRKALQIGKQLLEEMKSADVMENVYTSYMGLGDICVRKDNLKAGRQYYEMAVKVSEELMQKERRPDELNRIIACYTRLGNLTRIEGDITAARQYYQKGLVVAEDLAKTTKTVSSFDNLGICLFWLGRLGDGDRLMLQKAHAVYVTLEDMCPDIEEYHKRRVHIEKYLKNGS